MDPLKFQNKTNGVTPRRWLYMANPFLSELITEAVGSDEWVRELSLVQGLRPFAEDAAFRRRWATAKQRCKVRRGADAHLALPRHALTHAPRPREHRSAWHATCTPPWASR